MPTEFELRYKVFIVMQMIWWNFHMTECPHTKNFQHHSNNLPTTDCKRAKPFEDEIGIDTLRAWRGQHDWEELHEKMADIRSDLGVKDDYSNLEIKITEITTEH